MNYRRTTRGEVGKRVAATVLRSMYAPIHPLPEETAATGDPACGLCGGAGGWPGPRGFVACKPCQRAAAAEPGPLPQPIDPPLVPPPAGPPPKPVPTPGYPVHRMDLPPGSSDR